MIQIYTGDGKGKTTAAIGLAIRALGAGRRVYFAQFMKGWDTSELHILQDLENIVIDRNWDGSFIVGKPSPKQIEMVQKQLLRIQCALRMHFDLIVCDEIIVAFHFGMIEEDELLSLMESLPRGKELVLTGRGASEGLIKKADLVTEMKKIKHYFDAGVEARKGIEF